MSVSDGIGTETPLGRVRGLGSARHGAEHWGTERLTSLASLFLIVWFLVSLWRLPALDLATLADWLRQPLAATPMLLLVLAIFWHLRDGLIVIVEDYVHGEGARFTWIALIKFASLSAGALAAFCVLKLALATPVP